MNVGVLPSLAAILGWGTALVRIPALRGRADAIVGLVVTLGGGAAFVDLAVTPGQGDAHPGLTSVHGQGAAHPGVTPVQGQGADPLTRYLQSRQRPAIAALVEAARRRSVIVLGDVHPAAEPKRLMARLIAELHARDLIDAVALEVPMTQQPALREYLASDPENVDILLAHPLLLRPHWGLSEEYLEIYRTVWRLNHPAAHGDRRIEMLAIDAPRGPPMVSSRREALARFVQRDAIMEMRIRRWRESHPGGRLLVFVGDLHALRGVEANLELGDTFDRMVPLAERLSRLWPDAVYSVLSDATAPGHAGGVTRLHRLARPALGMGSAPLAIPLGPPVDSLSIPLLLEPDPGTPTIDLLPRSYTLGRITDLYLYFGRSSPHTPIEVPRP